MTWCKLIGGIIEHLESYIAPTDFTIDGYTVKQGDWVLGLFVPSTDLWKQIKSGELSAFSIVGVGRRLPVKD